jgi:hypothetical protein
LDDPRRRLGCASFRHGARRGCLHGQRAATGGGPASGLHRRLLCGVR